MFYKIDLHFILSLVLNHNNFLRSIFIKIVHIDTHNLSEQTRDYEDLELNWVWE